MITVNLITGSQFASQDDIERAENAALKVLEAFEWRKGQPEDVPAGEAFAAYQRHISDEDYMRSPRETMLIAAWEAAQSAADIALTEGWHDTNGAACELSYR